MRCAQGETRTPKDKSNGFWDRNVYQFRHLGFFIPFKFFPKSFLNSMGADTPISARKRIRTATVARHPLKVVRLPISPPGLIF